MFEKPNTSNDYARNYTQSTNFKFDLCSKVKAKDGRIGKVCAQIAKNFKHTYNILFGQDVVEYDMHEYELEKVNN